jgi:hypothetical protein
MKIHTLAHRAARGLARKRGVRKFIGDPCVQGHRGERYTRSNQCRDCVASQNVSQYAREQRAGLTDHGTGKWERLVPVKHRPVQALPLAPDGFIKQPTRQQLMGRR